MKKKKQIFNLFLFFLIIVVISVFWALPLLYINKLYSDLKYTEVELSKFKDISVMEKNIKDLYVYIAKKKNIIESLRKQKLDAVVLIEDIALNMPEKVSIESLKYEKNILEINGEAVSESDIAVFMLNIRSVGYVEDVKVVSVESTDKGFLKYVLQVKIKVVS